MKKATILLATLGVLSIPFLMRAQDLQSPGSPYSPDIFGPELIAWSQQQKPQPVPQPLPDPPEQPQEKQPVLPDSPDTHEQPAAQIFTGRIMNDHGRFVLQLSNNIVYQLDDQQKAGQYERKEVKIIGILEADQQTVRITNIELIS